MSLIEPKIRKPRIRLEISKGYKFVNDTVQANKLNTVCEEANALISMSAGTEKLPQL